MSNKIGNTLINFILGDITKVTVDAIVNAANSGLMGGGGVDGAIHRAGGPEILEECRKIILNIGRLPAGEAVITTGGNLGAKYVIHTVGPIWHGGDRGESQTLKNSYYNSLKLGAENNLVSIAFPSISSGIYGYPIEKAAVVAVDAVSEFLTNQKHTYKEVRFILFSKKDYKCYKEIIDKNI